MNANTGLLAVVMIAAIVINSTVAKSSGPLRRTNSAPEGTYDLVSEEMGEYASIPELY